MYNKSYDWYTVSVQIQNCYRHGPNYTLSTKCMRILYFTKSETATNFNTINKNCSMKKFFMTADVSSNIKILMDCFSLLNWIFLELKYLNKIRYDNVRVQIIKGGMFPLWLGQKHILHLQHLSINGLWIKL